MLATSRPFRRPAIQRIQGCHRLFSWHYALILASTLPTVHAFPVGTTAPLRGNSVPRSLSSTFLRRFLHQPSPSEGTDGAKKSPSEHILSKTPPEDHKIVKLTLQWLQNVVIGLNLCPFAEKPWRSQHVHLEVIYGNDEEEIVGRVLGECMAKQHNPGTSLMICPDLFPDKFESFLEVYNIMNDGVLVDQDLTDDIQIAPFHPLFEFDGSGSGGVDNFTNRSPYPVFHVLREEEVGRAVDLLDGDASKVWRRNVELLEDLSDELDDSELRQLMVGTPNLDSSIQERVQAVLRDLKKRTRDT